MRDVGPWWLSPRGAAEMGDEKEGSIHMGYIGAREMTLLREERKRK